MKMKDVFPSKYCAAADFRKPRIVTIDHVDHVAFKDNDGVNVTKPVLHFQGKDPRPMVCNKTNFKMLVAITGSDDDDDWGGQQIELRSKKVNAPGGKIVDGIRIHEAPGGSKPTKVKKAKDVPFDDEIPY
jgi:hypothetical protein